MGRNRSTRRVLENSSGQRVRADTASPLGRGPAQARALENPSEIPERLIELRSALDCLSDRQRIVVVLRYFVDLPDDEIAQALDVKPSTVRSLAHRALAVLRRELR